MAPYSPAWPHTDIIPIFPNIYFVMGTNKTTFNGLELQHSRNMVIIKDGSHLTLINTVRLSEDGLTELDRLGIVRHVVRLGAFHGRDDGFYLDRYKDAQLWAVGQMHHESGRSTDQELTPQGVMPFPDCSFFNFETSHHPEGILHINQQGGILITCDSLKNWLTADPYFSPESALLYEKQGLFGSASISDIWLQTCQVQASDFIRLKQLTFAHLISAHGVPLLDDAYTQVSKTIHAKYGV